VLLPSSHASFAWLILPSPQPGSAVVVGQVTGGDADLHGSFGSTIRPSPPLPPLEPLAPAVGLPPPELEPALGGRTPLTGALPPLLQAESQQAESTIHHNPRRASVRIFTCTGSAAAPRGQLTCGICALLSAYQIPRPEIPLRFGLDSCDSGEFRPAAQVSARASIAGASGRLTGTSDPQ
jgi:hypothetical protein